MNKANDIVRVLGPYRQYRDGTWFCVHPQTGTIQVNPNQSRGLRSYLHCALARRYKRKSFSFENKQHFCN